MAEIIDSDNTVNQYAPVFEMPLYNIERELGRSENIINEPTQERVENVEATEKGLQPEREDFIAGVRTFNEWLNHYGGSGKPVIVRLKETSKPVIIDKKPLPIPVDEFSETHAGDLARKSLQKDESLITETYAGILLKQGKIPQAISAYKRLSLINPEKSDYFASLIEKAKNQLK